MLVSLFKLIIFIFILRLIFPFVRGFTGAVSRMFSPAKKPSPGSEPAERDRYSELTSYEIEDADFEEIKEE